MNARVFFALTVLTPVMAWADESSPHGHVRIPLSAYQDLRNKANARASLDQSVSEEMDFQSVTRILQAQVSGSLSKRSLKLEIRVVVEGTSNGWHILPVMPLDLPLIDATITGGGTLIQADGMRSLAFEGPGKRTLVAHLVASGNESGGMRQVNLNILPGTSRQWILELGRGVDAEMEPSDLVRLERKDGKRSLRGHVPATAEEVEVRWSAQGERMAEDPPAQQPQPQENKSKDPPRINVQTSMLASVGERLLTVYTTHRYAIFHAPVSRFEWTVPAGVEVLGVQGRGVTEWTCSPGDVERACSVDLPFPVQRSYELSIQLEQPLPKDAARFQVPTPSPKGVQRTSGHMAVEVMGNAEVKGAPGTTAIGEDVRELPQDLLAGQSTPILLAFKFLEAPVKVVLDIARRESLEMAPISIDDASFTTVWTTEGRTITECNLAVRNRQRQFLAMGLPEGATPQSAFVGGRPVKPSTGEDGRIRIPLLSGGREAESESFAVQVIYSLDNVPLPSLGSVKPVLPTLDAEVGALHHTLVLPDEQYLWAFGGDLSNRSPQVIVERPFSESTGLMLGGLAANRGPMMTLANEEMNLPAAPQAMVQAKVAMDKKENAFKQMQEARVRRGEAAGDGMFDEMERTPQQVSMASSPLGQTGVLPVRIEIPKSGDRYTVHAFYVPPGKALQWTARVASTGLQNLALLITALLGLALGIIFVRQGQALWHRDPLNAERIAFLVGLCVCALLAIYLRRLALPLPVFAVLGIAGLWTYRAYQARAKQAQNS